MRPPVKGNSLAETLGQSLALPRVAQPGTMSLLDGLRAATAPPKPVIRDTAALLARGLTCAALRLDDLAFEALRDATSAGAAPPSAWRELALLLRRQGDVAGAQAAMLRAQSASEPSPPPPQSAGKFALAEKKLIKMLRQAAPRDSTTVLRKHLVNNPQDAPALYLLAGLAAAGNDDVEAERLLARVLELAPDYAAARQDYAATLLQTGKAARMLGHLDRLLAQAPGDLELLRLRATALELVGDNDGAIAALESIASRPAARDTKFWLSYGRCLHFAGRRADAVKAYRTAISLRPELGEAYWGIANLKSEPLTQQDFAAIRGHLANQALDDEDRYHFHYALGFALEVAGDYEASFGHYAAGAALRAAQLRVGGQAYDRGDMERQTSRHKAYFTAARLARTATPTPLPVTPIFVLGMPRSGSTLVEQILSSHSMIEGTQELPEIAHIARALGDADIMEQGFPKCLDRFSQTDLAELGQEYLRQAAQYRKTNRPFFIDKMPANWTNIGLIHLILPQAKIIDTRREPMSCCFSGFKQLIAKGAEYSCDLADLGHFYRQYVGLVEYYDAVLPGRIHRVTYETMVRETEAEITRLLAYCGVKFEEQCLRFWETKRTVATPSSEQVRKPIFHDALEQWRKYEPWLGPLKAALGIDEQEDSSFSEEKEAKRLL